MEFAFQDCELRDVCESDEKAREELGNEVAGALQTRIAEIRAATNVADLIAGNPRVLPDGTAYVLDLQNHRTLIFNANQKHCPVDAQGKIIWPRVRRIKIMMIGGHNDAGN